MVYQNASVNFDCVDPNVAWRSFAGSCRHGDMDNRWNDTSFNYIENMKKIISTEKAPAAVGPYSQAVEVKGTLYISGQVPLHPDTGKVITGGIAEQTARSLENIGAILEEAGYTYQNVVKCTCLLSDMANFAAMNNVYAKYFSSEQPARAAFAVRELPLGVLVEIEAIAVK